MNIRGIGLMTICIVGILFSSVYAEEADQLGKWRQQTSVFPVKVKVSPAGGSSNVPTVGGVAEFLLEIPQQPTGGATYDLYFFRDGLLDDVVKSIQLPYVFKQNFRGLNNGTYQLEFMLVNGSGEVGRVSQAISVQH